VFLFAGLHARPAADTDHHIARGLRLMKLIDKIEQHLPWAGAYLRDEYPATAEERRLLMFFVRTTVVQEHARQDRVFRIGLLTICVPTLGILVWSVVEMMR
jgi:hypothetical protein